LGRPGNLNQNTPPSPQPNINRLPLPLFPPQTPGTAVVSPDNRQVRYLPITPTTNPIDPSLEKPTTSTTKPTSPHPFSSPSPSSSSSSPSHSSTSFLPLPSFPLNLDVKIEVDGNDDDEDDDFEKYN
jgi:hypothetical protein